MSTLRKYNLQISCRYTPDSPPEIKFSSHTFFHALQNDLQTAAPSIARVVGDLKFGEYEPIATLSQILAYWSCCTITSIPSTAIIEHHESLRQMLSMWLSEHPVLPGYSNEDVAERLHLIAVTQLGRELVVYQRDGRLDPFAHGMKGVLLGWNNDELPAQWRASIMKDGCVLEVLITEHGLISGCFKFVAGVQLHDFIRIQTVVDFSNEPNELAASVDGNR